MSNANAPTTFAKGIGYHDTIIDISDVGTFRQVVELRTEFIEILFAMERASIVSPEIRPHDVHG